MSNLGSMSWTDAFGIGRPVTASTTTNRKVEVVENDPSYGWTGRSTAKSGAITTGKRRIVRRLNVNGRPPRVLRRNSSAATNVPPITVPNTTNPASGRLTGDIRSA